MIIGGVQATAASVSRGVMYREVGESAPVHGQVLPLDPITGAVHRADTGLIVSSFRSMGKFVLCSGICSANLYLLICTMYVWFALSIPRTCNVKLREAFLGLGFLNGFMGLVMGCFLFVAQTMLGAMTHSAIAEKYRLEGRDVEADSQDSDYEAEAQLASRAILVPSCLYLLSMNGLFVFWAFGCMEAMQADDNQCGGAGFVFWVLLMANIMNCFLSGASGTGAYQAPPGRVY